MTAQEVIAMVKAFGGSLHAVGGEVRYRGPKLPEGAPIRVEIARHKDELLQLCGSERLKPIQTVYRGYKMRSRLEARWAVYFDALGIEWDYEPQGFDLGEFGLYLPDFWLKSVDMWAEVKGTKMADAEARKCSALAEDSGFPVLMLEDSPAWKAYYAFEICDWDGAGCFGLGKHVRHVMWNDYIISSEFLHERRLFGSTGSSALGGTIGPCPSDVSRAILAARSARFEHGESGPTL